MAAWSKSQEFRQFGHVLLEVSRFHGDIWCVLTVSFSQNLCGMVETFGPDAGTVANVKAIREMMLSGNPCGGVNHVQNFRSQVITKRMLLERIAATLGCPVQVVDDSPPYVLEANCFNHHRITRLRGGTTSWPRSFNAIRDHVQTFQGPGEVFAPSQPTQSLSMSESLNYRALTMLVGARRNSRKSDYFRAACNLQLTAFMLLWHCNVSCLTPRMT